jgi:hypothetical protein
MKLLFCGSSHSLCRTCERCFSINHYIGSHKIVVEPEEIERGSFHSLSIQNVCPSIVSTIWFDALSNSDNTFGVIVSDKKIKILKLVSDWALLEGSSTIDWGLQFCWSCWELHVGAGVYWRRYLKPIYSGDIVVSSICVKEADLWSAKCEVVLGSSRGTNFVLEICVS